jgi:hypothetical protein
MLCSTVNARAQTVLTFEFPFCSRSGVGVVGKHTDIHSLSFPFLTYFVCLVLPRLSVRITQLFKIHRITVYTLLPSARIFFYFQNYYEKSKSLYGYKYISMSQCKVIYLCINS